MSRRSKCDGGRLGRRTDMLGTEGRPLTPLSNPLTLIANSPVLMPLRRARWQPRRTGAMGNNGAAPASTLPTLEPRGVVMLDRYTASAATRGAQSRGGTMKSSSFKTRPPTFSIGLAPTGRARCRGCKRVVEKGEARLVTHAFVRPGRSRDFVRHVGCVSPELVRAVIAAHGSVERVPTEKGMDGDALSGTCAQLCRVAV